MFTHLSIDWGSKRFGLAIGSQISGLILPLGDKKYETLNPKNWKPEILNILKQKKIKVIVLGLPTNFKHEDTLVTQKIREFKSELEEFLKNEKLDVKVEFFNERETTKFAKSLGIKDKKQINHVAASSILENYFEEKIHSNL